MTLEETDAAKIWESIDKTMETVKAWLIQQTNEHDIDLDAPILEEKPAVKLRRRKSNASRNKFINNRRFTVDGDCGDLVNDFVLLEDYDEMLTELNAFMETYFHDIYMKLRSLPIPVKEADLELTLNVCVDSEEVNESNVSNIDKVVNRPSIRVRGTYSNDADHNSGLPKLESCNIEENKEESRVVAKQDGIIEVENIHEKVSTYHFETNTEQSEQSIDMDLYIDFQEDENTLVIENCEQDTNATNDRKGICNGYIVNSDVDMITESRNPRIVNGPEKVTEPDFYDKLCAMYDLKVSPINARKCDNKDNLLQNHVSQYNDNNIREMIGSKVSNKNELDSESKVNYIYEKVVSMTPHVSKEKIDPMIISDLESDDQLIRAGSTSACEKQDDLDKTTSTFDVVSNECFREKEEYYSSGSRYTEIKDDLSINNMETSSSCLNIEETENSITPLRIEERVKNNNMRERLSIENENKLLQYDVRCYSVEQISDSCLSISYNESNASSNQDSDDLQISSSYDMLDDSTSSISAKQTDKLKKRSGVKEWGSGQNSLPLISGAEGDDTSTWSSGEEANSAKKIRKEKRKNVTSSYEVLDCSNTYSDVEELDGLNIAVSCEQTKNSSSRPKRVKEQDADTCLSERHDMKISLNGINVDSNNSLYGEVTDSSVYLSEDQDSNILSSFELMDGSYIEESVDRLETIGSLSLNLTNNSNATLDSKHIEQSTSTAPTTSETTSSYEVDETDPSVRLEQEKTSMKEMTYDPSIETEEQLMKKKSYESFIYSSFEQLDNYGAQDGNTTCHSSFEHLCAPNIYFDSNHAPDVYLSALLVDATDVLKANKADCPNICIACGEKHKSKGCFNIHDEYRMAVSELKKKDKKKKNKMKRFSCFFLCSK